MRYVAIDTETTGLDIYHDYPFKIGIIADDGEMHIINEPLNHTVNKYHLYNIEDYLRPDDVLVFFNAKFDIPMLRHIGFEPTKYQFHDAQLMAFNAFNLKKFPSLKWCSKTFLKKESPGDDVLEAFFQDLGYKKKDERDYSIIPDEILDPYLEEDIKHTLLLFYYLKNMINNRAYLADRDAIPVLIEMEKAGMKYSVEQAQITATLLATKMLEAQKEVEKKLGIINLNSPKQIVEAFNRINIPITKSDKIALIETRNETAFKLLEYRKWSKYLRTYVINFIKMADKNHRIHTNFNQCNAVTGRLSSNGPCLQNIPHGDTPEDALIVRGLIVPEENHILIGYDYDQIELRIFACVSQCKEMLQCFKNNIDVHSRSAEFIFGEVDEEKRFIAKQVNFGIIYGMGPGRLAYELNTSAYFQGLIKELVDPMQAEEWYKTYHEAYPEINEFMGQSVMEANTYGYVVDIFNRKYFVPKEEPYKGANYKVQGPAGTIMKEGMKRVQDYLDLAGEPTWRIILTVHDEIIIETPIKRIDDYKKIVNLFEDKNSFGVPLTVGVNFMEESWGKKRKIKVA